MKFLLSIIVVVLFLHCEKKVVPPEPSETKFVNDTFLRYWYFPEGSWWVYKRMDTTADVYDTAIVVRTEKKMIFGRFAPYEWERYEMNIEHSYFHPTTGDKSRNLNQFIRNDGQFINRISSSSNGSGFNYTYFFSWPIDSAAINNKSRGGGGRSILIDINDIQLSVGNIDHVVHIYMTYHDVWLAKNIGFIKYIHHWNEIDSSTWELTEYYINN